MSFAVDGLRENIEAQMVDEVTFTRQTGEPTVNAGTGALEYEDDPTDVYQGPCLIDQMSTRAKVLAGYALELDVFDVVLPMTADGIRKGDDGAVVACGNDPDLVGAALQVDATFGGGTLAVSRRVTAIRVGQAQPTAGD